MPQTDSLLKRPKPQRIIFHAIGQRKVTSGESAGSPYGMPNAQFSVETFSRKYPPRLPSFYLVLVQLATLRIAEPAGWDNTNGFLDILRAHASFDLQYTVSVSRG